MRRLIAALSLAALTALALTAPATAGSRESTIMQAYRKACPASTEYVACRQVDVTIGDYGPTGWTATAGPAAGTVTFNSFYTLSRSSWERTVAHEMGGHHDLWQELVARVGTSQAWTDYYQVDTLAQAWLAGKGYSLTTTISKEVWLDCEGPVAHGYGPGAYMINRGIPTSACEGWRSVVEAAIAG